MSEIFGFPTYLWGYAAVNVFCVGLVLGLVNRKRLPFLEPGGIREWSFMGAVVFVAFALCNIFFGIPVVILSGEEGFQEQKVGHLLTASLLFALFLGVALCGKSTKRNGRTNR